jgi:exosortase A
MSIAIRRDFGSVVMIGGVAALVALVYADTFVSLAAGWSYQDYSHGMLVFPISAYLVWRLQSSLGSLDLRPWPWGIAVMFALVMIWLLSNIVGVQAAEHLAAVLLIPAAIATCLGLPIVRCALFPLLFLVAAVPMWDALIPPLMAITADVSAWLLRVFGVPVYREGQFLSLPGGDFEVADVCSGLRSLVSGVTIALLFSYLTFRSSSKRALFVAFAAVSLIAVNGLRAFIVMYVASATDLRWLAGTDHIYFGWILFAILIAILFWVGSRYSDRFDDAPRDAAPTSTTRGAGAWPLALILGLVMLAITAQPFRRDIANVWWVLPAGAVLLWAVSRFMSVPAAWAVAGATSSVTRGRLEAGSTAVVAAAVAVLIGGPLVLNRPLSDAATAPRALTLPVGSCGPAEPLVGVWRPEWQSPDVTVAGSYRCGNEIVNVSIAGYWTQAQGRELVSDQNRFFPDNWRQFVTINRSQFETARGHTAVREVHVAGPGRGALIWYWYVVGDQTATDPVAVKLSQALELVTSGRTDGAVYWLQTQVTPSVEAGRARLEAVARDVAPVFAASAGHRRPR